MLFNIGLVLAIAALINFSVAEYSTSKETKKIGYVNTAFMYIIVLILFMATL